MRLIHTSDWHLGRSLHGVDQLDAQAGYLDHLVELSRAERADGVLIAGDVFDRAVPQQDAVELLTETLRRLAEVTRVVAIPGNHDSATRLAYGSSLWRSEVRLIARPGQIGDPVEIETDDQRALVYAIPYLDPDLGRVALADGETLARSHQAVMDAAMTRIRANAAINSASHAKNARSAGKGPAAIVVIAHAFVVGGAATESERDIRVGGVDSVTTATFAGADYVALGHLHGPQRIGADDGPHIRYAGSPLAYSFSEKDQTKSTALVTIGPGGSVSAELIPAPVPRRLSELRGPLADILGPAGEAQRNDFVRVVVTDPARPEQLYLRVKNAFPHLLRVTHEPPDTGTRQAIRVHAGLDPMAVANAFFRFATGGGPSDAETAVLRGALEDVRRSETPSARAASSVAPSSPSPVAASIPDRSELKASVAPPTSSEEGT